MFANVLRSCILPDLDYEASVELRSHQALAKYQGNAVTCWEIATGLMPIRGQMTPPTEEECPRQVTQLIADLMKRDPRARPSAAEAFRYGSRSRKPSQALAKIGLILPKQDAVAAPSAGSS